MKKIFFFITGILLPALILHSQNPFPEKSLQPGDTLPLSAIHRVTGYAADSIAADSLRGRALLLDFFEVWCSGCLELLPRLDSIQRTFGSRIRVLGITQHGKAAVIRQFLLQKKALRHIHIPVATEDTVLHAYFPHELISHLVWIDSTGKVVAITGSSEVNENNIRLLLSGGPMHLPVKRDVMGFDYLRPLLSQPAGTPSTAFCFYSALTSGMEGIDATSRQVADTVSQTYTLNYFNTTIGHLLGKHINHGFFIPAKKATGNVELLAARQPLFCYSLTLPLSMPAAGRSAFEAEDMGRWLQHVLGVTVTKSRQLHPCLVLTATDSAEKRLATVHNERVNTLGDHSGKLKQLLHAPLSEFTRFLNQWVEGIPWVIDETKLSDQLLIDLSLHVQSLSDIPALQKELQRYGLRLKTTRREMDVFDIHQQTPLVQAN